MKNEILKMKGEYHEHQSTGRSLKAPTYRLSEGEGCARLVSEAFHQGAGDRCGFGRTLLYPTGERFLQFVQGLWRLSVQPLKRLEGESRAGLKGSTHEGTPRSRSRGCVEAPGGDPLIRRDYRWAPEALRGVSFPRSARCLESSRRRRPSRTSRGRGYCSVDNGCARND